MEFESMPSDWQARAVAAEVALESMRVAIANVRHWHNTGRDDEGTIISSVSFRKLHEAADKGPDLTAARELIRKAGEAEGLARTVGVMREALVMIMRGCSPPVDDVTRATCTTAEAAIALPLPEAVKIATAEREFCDATLDWSNVKGNLEDQSDRCTVAFDALIAARSKA